MRNFMYLPGYLVWGTEAKDGMHIWYEQREYECRILVGKLFG
jgi:hypothetical protein